MQNEFNKEYDLEIGKLISQLLLIQQKRLVEKDELFCDESLLNFIVKLPRDSNLFENISSLEEIIANMLSQLEE
jgi:hypothetical protein